MITGERCEDKLCAVRHLDVRDIVARGAGPTRFGPESKTFATVKRHAGKAVSLIVGIAALSRVIASQQLHHCRGTCWVRDFASNDLEHQPRGGVGRQLIAVLSVWPARHTLATVSIFAECLLIH